MLFLVIFADMHLRVAAISVVVFSQELMESSASCIWSGVHPEGGSTKYELY